MWDRSPPVQTPLSSLKPLPAAPGSAPARVRARGPGAFPAPRGEAPAGRAGASAGRQTGAHFAALDLGTNNCRLLIARPAGSGFRVVDAFSRIVRLGEGLAASGLLSAAAMARAIEALRICADKIAARNVAAGRYVATEACRRAANCEEFLARVRAETGLAIETISSREEARLVVSGCAALLNPRIPYAIVFDIGGGARPVRADPSHPALYRPGPGADAGQLGDGDDAGGRAHGPAPLYPRPCRRQHPDLRADRPRLRPPCPARFCRPRRQSVRRPRARRSRPVRLRDPRRDLRDLAGRPPARRRSRGARGHPVRPAAALKWPGPRMAVPVRGPGCGRARRAGANRLRRHGSPASSTIPMSPPRGARAGARAPPSS